MEYYGSIVIAWTKQNGNPREETEVFSNEIQTHEAIQRRLNKLYPGAWMYNVGTHQYVHVSGSGGDDTLASIRLKLSRVEILERDIAMFERKIAEYQKSLNETKHELELAKTDDTSR
jgi:hypothetical protein